jgi:AmmeMemoRadiSam system protein B
VIRQPYFAGRFYPADRAQLASLVLRLLRGTEEQVCEHPRALIVPHAGYAYSGACAARAYALIANARHAIQRVAIFGTCHTRGVSRLVVPRADAFDSPLGAVLIDRQAVDELLEFSDTKVDDDAHSGDHAIEVQLPFLQVSLTSFRLVPVLVGRAPISSIVRAIAHLSADPATLIVVSSDLSHYLTESEARRIDTETAKWIVNLEPDLITAGRACGYRVIRALVVVARERHDTVRLIDLRTSADAGGSSDRVVGYGAFVIHAATARVAGVHTGS